MKPEGRGFKSHPGQSFPLSLCGPSSICRANAHMVYGLKHQHFTSHSITLFVLNTVSVCWVGTTKWGTNRIKHQDKYSLRHRKCGVRGYMHELFVSKPRTSEVRASEGF